MAQKNQCPVCLQWRENRGVCCGRPFPSVLVKKFPNVCGSENATSQIKEHLQGVKKTALPRALDILSMRLQSMQKMADKVPKEKAMLIELIPSGSGASSSLANWSIPS